MFHIVLVEPEIPQNTGNIARTCAVTGCALHLVRPLGFEIDDKKLKRAGLDYWHSLEIHYHNSFEELEREHEGGRFHLASTHAAARYTDARYQDGDFWYSARKPPAWAKAYSAGALRTRYAYP